MAESGNGGDKIVTPSEYKTKQAGTERAAPERTNFFERARVDAAQQQLNGMIEGLRMAGQLFSRALNEPANPADHPQVPTGVIADENDFRNTTVTGWTTPEDAERMKAERYAREKGAGQLPGGVSGSEEEHTDEKSTTLPPYSTKTD